MIRPSRSGRMLLGAAAILAAVAAPTGLAPVSAQVAGFDSRQPVDYEADRIELQDRQGRVILSGNVVIKQGALRLTAARTTVSYTNQGSLRIQRIDAAGGVNVVRGGETARGDVAVYDLNRRTIVMTGNVALRRNGDTLNGGRLTIDLNTGLATVAGGGGGARGGRVSGTFAVPNS